MRDRDSVQSQEGSWSTDHVSDQGLELLKIDKISHMVLEPNLIFNKIYSLFSRQRFLTTHGRRLT